MNRRYDIFISYAREDGSEYAKSLTTALRPHGISCFFDCEELPIGVGLSSTIRTALDRSTALVLVGSDAALASGWVDQEVSYFLATRKSAVLPISIASNLKRCPWRQVREMAWVAETRRAFTLAAPSKGVVGEVCQAFTRLKENKNKGRQLAAWSVVCILILMSLGSWYAMTPPQGGTRIAEWVDPPSRRERPVPRNIESGWQTQPWIWTGSVSEVITYANPLDRNAEPSLLDELPNEVPIRQQLTALSKGQQSFEGWPPARSTVKASGNSFSTPPKERPPDDHILQSSAGNKSVHAVAIATIDGLELSGPVAPGQIVGLTGARSYIAGGTPHQNANLIYRWRQVGGPGVFARGLQQRDAEMVLVSLSKLSSAVTIEFQLTVRSSSSKDTTLVAITVDPALETVAREQNLYLCPCFFGSAENVKFRTHLIIDNLTEEDIKDVRIDFFASDGSPLQVDYLAREEAPPEVSDGNPGLTIPSNMSRVLTFRDPSGPPPKIGWAKITSSTGLRASARLQVLSPAGGVLSDAGILSSAPGSKFQAAVRSKDAPVLVVCNTESETVRVSVSFVALGGVGVEKTIDIGPHEIHHESLSALISAQSPEGTLVVETQDWASIASTLLITR